MRVLFVPHRVPYPPNKGEKIRSFNILQALSREHTVDLCFPIDSRTDSQFIQPLKDFSENIITEFIDHPLRRALALKSLASGQSITVGQFYTRKLQTEFDGYLDRFNVDAIVCSSSPMAEYVFRSDYLRGNNKRCLTIMDLIDVDSCKWSDYASAASWPKSLLYRYESTALRRYENRICEEFDAIYVVSENEKSRLAKPGERVALQAMSNGVDLQYFCPQAVNVMPSAGRAPSLVFTGVMNYEPNVSGMRWFLDHVFPRLRATVTDLEVIIVGSSPTPSVRRWSDLDGVTVTGFVDDVREYLQQASVCIVPLLIARGIQNKLLEAMAMAKPIVCTSKAAAGADAVAGEHFVVADSADDFAAAVLRLLDDARLADTMGQAARRRVETRYSWAANLQPLIDRLQAHHTSEKPDGAAADA